MWDGSLGATLKAPFAQTPGDALSSPPGKNHLSGTAPFSVPLRHRGLVKTHHRAPPTCRPAGKTPMSQKAADARPSGREEIWIDGAICTDARDRSLWPTRQESFVPYCSFFLPSPSPRSRQRAPPGRLTKRSAVPSKAHALPRPFLPPTAPPQGPFGAGGVPKVLDCLPNGQIWRPFW